MLTCAEGEPAQAQPATAASILQTILVEPPAWGKLEASARASSLRTAPCPLGFGMIRLIRCGEKAWQATALSADTHAPPGEEAQLNRNEPTQNGKQCPLD